MGKIIVALIGKISGKSAKKSCSNIPFNDSVACSVFSFSLSFPYAWELRVRTLRVFSKGGGGVSPPRAPNNSATGSLLQCFPGVAKAYRVY